MARTAITRMAALVSILAPLLAAQSGAVRWTEGTENCTREYLDGLITKIITIPIVDWQRARLWVSLKEEGGQFTALVMLTNDTLETNIDLIPATMHLIGGDGKPIFSKDPQKIIASADRRYRIARALAGAQGGYLEASGRTTTSSGTVRTSDGRTATVDVTTTEPNTEAVAIAQQRGEELRAQQADYADSVRSYYLYANTIHPKQYAVGRVAFDRPKDRKLVLVRIPIRGVAYEFPFYFKDKKARNGE